MLDIEKIKSSGGSSLFASHVYFFHEINSTNIFAKTIGENEDALVITDYQTQGLGRMGRTWESEEGKNLTLTLKKKFDIEPEHAQSVSFFFSYFLLAAVKDYIAKNIDPNDSFPELHTKWPNDVLLNSKKIGGLLIENNITKKQFIIGIGININQEKFSSEIHDKALSLKNFLRHDIDRTDFLIELLNIYQHNIHLLLEGNHDLIYKLWKDSSNLIGKEAVYSDGSNKIKNGKIIDLGRDGSLKMQINGEILTFFAGELHIRIGV
jgi:BirA family transcriptional regulator, biotin operon repressor / biotin---[acetyl-CoA-carboxylase] ligase